MQLKKREMLGVFSKLKMDVDLSHHKNAYFKFEGTVYLKTRISHGKGNIPGPVIERIRKQLFLTTTQFKELIECPSGYDGFVKILQKKGIIPERV